MVRITWINYLIMYEDKLKWSKELADRIKKDFNPYAVIVGYTGGTDSNIALKLATMFFNVDAAFTCNTTISAIETLQNCERVAKEVYNLKYISRMPPYGGLQENPNTYFELVKQHGFPGQTKTAHNWMYRYLKDHTVQKIVSSFRQRKRNRPIVIISGARRHESVRRMGTSQDITVIGNTIWVNIANDWTNQDCSDFASDYNIDELRSPISKGMGISGECFCGSHASGKGELNEIKFWSPSTFDLIDKISTHLKLLGFEWEWFQSPPKNRKIERAGQQNMFSPQMLMCSTCMNNPVIINLQPAQ
jgi:3'-phosphoadenosine 5'-phosphosulfate sulfotransferase (PAPS reductase)/FAD synthetase